MLLQNLKREKKSTPSTPVAVVYVCICICLWIKSEFRAKQTQIDVKAHAPRVPLEEAK